MILERGHFVGKILALIQLQENSNFDQIDSKEEMWWYVLRFKMFLNPYVNQQYEQKNHSPCLKIKGFSLHFMTVKNDTNWHNFGPFLNFLKIFAYSGAQAMTMGVFHVGLDTRNPQKYKISGQVLVLLRYDALKMAKKSSISEFLSKWAQWD